VVKNKKAKIVGIGEVVSDILPDSRKLGGAPADFLKYAVKNGADGYLISAIGADDLGREIISELEDINVTPVLAITPYPTGRVLIFDEADNYPVAHILENAAWDYLPFEDKAENCVKNADAVYFDTLALRKAYSRETILDLIDLVPEDAFRFFDINLRQNYFSASLIQKLLERANILKINAEELIKLRDLFGLSGTPETICLKLKNEYKLKYLIYSDKAKMNLIWGDDGVTSAKNERLDQGFAFGVGNAFGGTFMSAILNGASQKEAHEQANKIAAEICKHSAL
jgi:fructokinase